MKLTFLGTGSSQGVPVVACVCPTCKSLDVRDQRLRSSIYLTQGDKNILIDAGPDLRYQALKMQIKRIDALLLTHEHKDHIGGLSEIRRSIMQQKQPIAVYARERVLDSIQKEFHYLFAQPSQPALASFELHGIERASFEVSGTTVTPLQVYHHTLPIHGFRIGPLTYITDAKVVPEAELEKLRGTRVLVVNALRQKKHDAHFNLNEALNFASRVGAETTYLTHISHQMGRHKDVSKELPQNVQLAYDGLQISL